MFSYSYTQCTHSSSGKRSFGFTLIELLISVAIIGVITGIIVLKYRAFDSTTLLKGAAYEIALALRETQVRSVSALQHDDKNFDNPYGITFTPSQKTYTVFEFTTTSEDPYYDVSDPVPVYAKAMNTVTLDRGIRVVDVCVTVGSNTYCNTDGVTRLDVSFKRPEFKAYYYAKKSGGDLSSTIDSATIKVSSTNNSANVFKVIVSRLGQISVVKE